MEIADYRGAGQSISVRPVPALAPFVTALGYYSSTFTHSVEQGLPSGTSQLMVNLAEDVLWCHPAGDPNPQRIGGAGWVGPCQRPALLDQDQQRAILWVAFRPGGSYPFFAAPAAAARDQLVPLDTVWGATGATLRERLLAAADPRAALHLLQSILLGRAARPLASDPAIRVAAAALPRRPVTQVCDALGWTDRQLYRRFLTQVGLSPKRYARLGRFQRLLRTVNHGGRYGRAADWGQLAAQLGYHDQPHLIHEFRRFAGLRPTEYAPRSPEAGNHVPVVDRE